MKLIEVIDNINAFTENLIIYTVGTEKITGNTETKLYSIEDIVEGKIVPKGCSYFLEVVYVQEVIDNWIEWRKGRQPSSKDKLTAVLYYVEHDAYLPTK